ARRLLRRQPGGIGALQAGAVQRIAGKSDGLHVPSLATRNFRVKSLYPRLEVRWTCRSLTRSGRERSSRTESGPGRRGSTSSLSGRKGEGGDQAARTPYRICCGSPASTFPRKSPNPAPVRGAACYSPPMAQPYRVLARKYRPTDFTGLIGQEALVRT